MTSLFIFNIGLYFSFNLSISFLISSILFLISCPISSISPSDADDGGKFAALLYIII